MYLYDEAYAGEEQLTAETTSLRSVTACLRNHLHGPDRPDSVPTYVTTDTANLRHLVTKEITLNGLQSY